MQFGNCALVDLSSGPHVHVPATIPIVSVVKTGEFGNLVFIAVDDMAEIEPDERKKTCLKTSLKKIIKQNPVQILKKPDILMLYPL